ncbi:MAG: sigma-70 family RNA polymerase sigma factor [Bacteroidales bacterium]|nr:sigma-70 family RNA polymerase sigma factor [Bacteroidales bacterium]
MLNIQPKDYWEMAAKAVKAYANKTFACFFTEAEVEDIVAEVVTKMWRARESYNPDKGTVFGWVWTIAKNAVNDAARAKRKREDVGGCWNDDVEKLAEGIVADDRADRQLLMDEVVEKMYNRLKQERDKRILLYLVDGLDNEEIAEREGLTKQGACMAVYHVRRRLEDVAA